MTLCGFNDTFSSYLSVALLVAAAANDLHRFIKVSEFRRLDKIRDSQHAKSEEGLCLLCGGREYQVGIICLSFDTQQKQREVRGKMGIIAAGLVHCFYRLMSWAAA